MHGILRDRRWSLIPEVWKVARPLDFDTEMMTIHVWPACNSRSGVLSVLDITALVQGTMHVDEDAETGSMKETEEREASLDSLFKNTSHERCHLLPTLGNVVLPPSPDERSLLCRYVDSVVVGKSQLLRSLL